MAGVSAELRPAPRTAGTAHSNAVAHAKKMLSVWSISNELNRPPRAKIITRTTIEIIKESPSITDLILTIFDWPSVIAVSRGCQSNAG